MNDADKPMMDGLNITVKPTKYLVSALPEDDINCSAWTLTIENRGGDRWAVVRYGTCLGIDGEWDYEPRASEREGDWIAAHRFDFKEATRLAREAIPKISVNGTTVGQYLAARAEEVP